MYQVKLGIVYPRGMNCPNEGIVGKNEEHMLIKRFESQTLRHKIAQVLKILIGARASRDVLQMDTV